MMTVPERKKYMSSSYYRAIMILSGFRKMLSYTSQDIASAIWNIWKKKDEKRDDINKNFMTLVDLGYIELGIEEIRAYFDIIFRDYVAFGSQNNVTSVEQDKKLKALSDIAFKKLLKYAEDNYQDEDFDNISNSRLAIIQIKSTCEFWNSLGI